MSIRLLSSDLTVAANANGEIVSAIANLSEVVPSTAVATPVGLKLIGTPPADLLVSRLVLRSTKNPEAVYRVAQFATAIKLADAMALLEPDAAGTPISEQSFSPDHGLELALTMTNGATAFTGTVVWKIENQAAGPLGPFGPEGFFGAVRNIVSKASGGKALPPLPPPAFL